MFMPNAYEGQEPYIFISYAHKDSNTVLPIIQGLQERGFRVWYDAGIEIGTEWPQYIATHLKHCHSCLAFVSPMRWIPITAAGRSIMPLPSARILWSSI